VEIRNRENFQQENMFAEIHEVVTQQEKSERVLNKLEKALESLELMICLEFIFPKI
jgi:hypothetical protein